LATKNKTVVEKMLLNTTSWLTEWWSLVTNSLQDLEPTNQKLHKGQRRNPFSFAFASTVDG
jgi:hypothetical protein